MTVIVDQAGTLQDKVSSLGEEQITDLTIIGPLNASDLKFLCSTTEENGNYSSNKLKRLDLQEVSLVATNEQYSKTETGANFGDNTYYYLSDSCYIEETGYTPYGWDFSILYTKYHGNDLGGFCCSMSNLEYIAFPKTLKGLGQECLLGSNVSTIVFPDNLEYVKYNAFGNTPWYKDYLQNQPDGVVYFQDMAYDYKGDIPSDNTITFRDGTKGIVGHYGIDGVKYINIPGSVKYLGDYCFRGDLCVINMEEGLESIGFGVFENCKYLTNINLPNSVKYIENYAFKNSSISSIHIPTSLVSFKKDTFSSCQELESIYIDDLAAWCNVNIPCRTEETHAYETGSPLCIAEKLYVKGEFIDGKLIIPEGIKTINHHVFSGCKCITSVSIPSTIDNFGDYAFLGCENLTTVDISGSDVGLGAFQDCSNLTTATIDCQTIGEYAFSDCNKLNDITLNNVSHIRSRAFWRCTALETISLDGVSNIGANAFEWCTSLKEMSFNNVVEIGDNAFHGCTALTKALFNSVVVIGNHAFDGCTSLGEISLNDVTVIGDYAFRNCQLEGVLDLSSEKYSSLSIGDRAFSGNFITEVNINCQKIDCPFSGNPLKKGILGPNVVGGGTLTTERLEKLTVYCAQNLKGIGTPCDTIIIKGCCKEIPEGWELDTDNLILEEGVETLRKIQARTILSPYDIKNEGQIYGIRSITIPTTIKNFLGHIGNYYCTNVEEIHIKDIRSWCEINFVCSPPWAMPFYYQDNNQWSSPVKLFLNDELLSDVVIPEGTTIVNNGAFYKSLITSVTVPSTVKVIGDSAFADCSALQNVYLKDSLATIKSSAFSRCTNLEHVELPKNLRAIEDASFAGCYNLKDVRIPKSLRLIGDRAFSSCESLDSICLPANLVAIGRRAFYNCSNLKKIQSDNKFPTDIDADAFYDVALNATLYVPAGTKQIYAQKAGWNLFTNIVELPNVEITPITESKEVSFSDKIDETTNLTNTVIDDTYYNMGATNSDGYDSNTQAIVLNSTTSAEQMDAIQDAEIGDATVREDYSGIIFELAKGSGTITVDAKTIGTHVLMVQIGNNAPTKVTKSERGIVDVPYEVTEPTYVYLYARTADGNAARLSRAAAGENSVLLYGYKVTIELAFIPGDANGDGVVNVTDIVEIVNDILGHPSAKFDPIAADVNGDGVVNVTDIVSVVNIILSSNARELTNRAAATNNLKLSGASIKLRDAENYTAAQFDIHLSDGSTVNYLSLNSASDHQMTWKMVDANTCRVIVYSLSNAPFRAVKDELFNVTLSGNATISNELLVNVDGMVTGINEMQFDKPVDVYDLQGNKVRSNTTDLNGLQKGVYIVNGKKVIVK